MKERRPMVSVAMITYNHEKYIRQAIDSILMQEVNFDYEIVIGEDNSPDNTRAILLQYKEKYPNKIKLLLRDENMGPTKNLYDVFINCSGKYIAVLEGDDYWTDPKKLKIQVKFLEKNDDYIASGHFVSVINNNSEKIGVLPSNSKILESYNIEQIYQIKKYSVNLHLQSLLFRNIFFNRKEIYFNILTSSNYIMDWAILFLLSYKGKINIKKRIMGVYRFITKDNSTSFSALNDEIQICEYLKMIEGLKQLFNNNKKIFYKLLYDAKKQMLLIQIKNLNFNAAIKYYIKNLNFNEKINVIILVCKSILDFLLKKIKLKEQNFLIENK